MTGQCASGSWSSSGASSILTLVYALTASLECPEHPGVPEIASKTLGAVICDAEAPCSQNTAQFPDTARAISPLNTPLSLYFLNLLSNWHFSRWQRSMSVATCTVPFAFITSRISSLASYFRIVLHWEICPLLAHCNVRFRHFHRLRNRN